MFRIWGCNTSTASMLRSLRRRPIRPTAAVALPTRAILVMRPSATLDIPIWDWFSTHEKIKQGSHPSYPGTDGVDDYAAAIDCLAE